MNDRNSDRHKGKRHYLSGRVKRQEARKKENDLAQLLSKTVPLRELFNRTVTKSKVSQRHEATLVNKSITNKPYKFTNLSQNLFS